MVFDLDNLVRDNIRSLTPYSSARSEFDGAARIFLDANENSYGSPLSRPYNRYPDPKQTAVKSKIAKFNDVSPQQIFVGNGSDEAIDLLFRVFCRPAVDNIIICPPTYGMYEVAANINEVEVRSAPLTAAFELDLDRIQDTVSKNTKLIFICSPNNPTGNLMPRESIIRILESFRGIVVVDEAYIHFADGNSLISEIGKFPNLAVLQTFSKAWGLAGLRVGLVFANEKVIELLDRIKPPYNISLVAQELLLGALKNQRHVERTIAKIKQERARLGHRLEQFSFVKVVYPSDANFVLVKTDSAAEIYKFLLNEQIVVRNRSNIRFCDGCLRITIGTPIENDALIEALEKYEKSLIH